MGTLCLVWPTKINYTLVTCKCKDKSDMKWHNNLQTLHAKCLCNSKYMQSTIYIPYMNILYIGLCIYRRNELFILLPNKNIAVRSNLHENKCNLLFSKCVLCISFAICTKQADIKPEYASSPSFVYFIFYVKYFSPQIHIAGFVYAFLMILNLKWHVYMRGND